jgi:hypothetical protein
MLLEEGVEVGEQVSVALIAYAATLLGRRHCVNVSDCRHYFPFGPRGSTVSGRQYRRTTSRYSVPITRVLNSAAASLNIRSTV